MVTATPLNPDLEKQLLAELRSLRAEVRALAEQKRAQDELLEEMVPIVKSMLAVGADRLGELEAKGYFAFARELGQVADKVVTGFSPQDVRQLGDNVVQILGTVRHLTQPAVLTIAEEASAALEEADRGEVKGWRGLWKASHDPEVQRGMATLIAVLKRVGRLSDGPRQPRARLDKLLAPSRPKALPPPARKAAPAAQGACCAPGEAQGERRREAGLGPAGTRRPKGPKLDLPGVALDAEGFLAEPERWTPELGREIARQLGITLTEAHLKVLQFARADYLETNKAPNVRRLSTGSGVSVKELYTLFPGTPGLSAARIAGIKKPVGCI